MLATITGVVLVIAATTTIAIAAGGGGPVPRPARLATAIHTALVARQVPGISAAITFTNRLINASEIQGPTDPLLSGGSGHLWLSSTGQLRIELYGDNGDPAVVVNTDSWWVSDPMTQTVYEGSLPKSGGSSDKKTSGSIPTVAQIQSDLNKLAVHLNVSGALPTDVAGQPTYTVRVSSKQSGGLIGEVQLAWDAIRGVPLRFGIYARGDSTPVLGLEATGITYSRIDRSIFAISPPAGYKVVKVSTPAGNAASDRRSGKDSHRAHAAVTGARAVAKHLPFDLVAPRTLAGLQRQSTTLLDWGGHPAALITYGQNLGGIAVIEQAASATSSRRANLSASSGGAATGLVLPNVTIGGVSAQELDTALGTILRFTRGSVTYTVVGSVAPHVAEAAARAL